MGKEVVVLWFRNDLRLQDNAALVEAIKCGLPVLPLFIFSPEDEGRWGPGQAARLWISRRYKHQLFVIACATPSFT
jgi:deoxyribodipyrimidine photo-lyase